MGTPTLRRIDRRLLWDNAGKGCFDRGHPTMDGDCLYSAIVHPRLRLPARALHASTRCGRTEQDNRPGEGASTRWRKARARGISPSSCDHCPCLVRERDAQSPYTHVKFTIIDPDDQDGRRSEHRQASISRGLAFRLLSESVTFRPLSFGSRQCQPAGRWIDTYASTSETNFSRALA